jgi:hypothetical protein
VKNCKVMKVQLKARLRKKEKYCVVKSLTISFK